MQQKPMSLIEFQRKFATEKACQEHLFRLRWPDGYQCPGVTTSTHISIEPVTCTNARHAGIRPR